MIELRWLKIYDEEPMLQYRQYVLDDEGMEIYIHDWKDVETEEI